jgi:hypothetical protein
MLDTAAVLALAPDPASAKAGQGLAAARHWSELGHDDDCLWGLCKGSGKDPYQTRVALVDVSSSCSCPSRKFPCKHVIGLLLLGAQGAVARGAAPAYVSEWMAKKLERVERKLKADTERTPEQLAKAAAAADKRAESRQERRAEGLADLRLWMTDLVRSGLASAPVTDAAFWDSRARRLVDAQIPGLARRLQRCYQHAIRRADWPEAVLREFGLIELAAAAHGQIESLPAAQRADLERALGVAQGADAIDIEQAIEDDFLCLGVSTESLETVTLQRSWWCNAGGKLALVLNFTANGLPLQSVALPGRSERLRLAWYAGAQPLRAQLLERAAAPQPVAAPGSSVSAALLQFAAALAADPWLDLLALSVRGCLRIDARQNAYLCDDQDQALPLGAMDADIWQWLARSRGQRWCFSGEWDGERLHLLHGWPA